MTFYAKNIDSKPIAFNSWDEYAKTPLYDPKKTVIKHYQGWTGSGELIARIAKFFEDRFETFIVIATPGKEPRFITLLEPSKFVLPIVKCLDQTITLFPIRSAQFGGGEALFEEGGMVSGWGYLHILNDIDSPIPFKKNPDQTDCISGGGCCNKSNTAQVVGTVADYPATLLCDEEESYRITREIDSIMLAHFLLISMHCHSDIALRELKIDQEKIATASLSKPLQEAGGNIDNVAKKVLSTLSPKNRVNPKAFHFLLQRAVDLKLLASQQSSI